MNKTIYKITAMKFEDPKDGEAKVTAKYKELHGAPAPFPLPPAPFPLPPSPFPSPLSLPSYVGTAPCRHRSTCQEHPASQEHPAHHSSSSQGRI